MFDEYLSWKPYFEIVPMQHEDCAAVAELHALRFPRPWNDGEFSGLLTQGSVFGAVARQTNAFFSKPLGGFVLAREVAGEAEILTVAVADKFARAGLGWRLMQSAIREAMMRGAETMFLEVDNNNAPALGLYRKLGFKTVAERKAYYTAKDGTKSTALVMRRDLR
ncbi:GNAT family N-acetyltransferase [Agrobacterium pusense]|uniref:GNAT family N-acetyltransferase n=1 Tax=Agrobacterium pusense TaxID=648995 RepID=A0AA44ENQ3_9HYPH|nr:N-acetyltransferase [Agrobacterium pusense]NRF11014.1 GNAT family N-acetyltransferase [Agrobacterium pusense]NRF21723.1 GNAT family N-acetyltransferase [Agrobacterium pusense]